LSVEGPYAHYKHNELDAGSNQIKYVITIAASLEHNDELGT